MSCATDLTWKASALPEALGALARALGLGQPQPRPGPGDAGAAGLPREALERWVEEAAAEVGLEVERIRRPHGGLARLALGSAPALVLLADAAEPRWLAVGGRREMLTPDQGTVRVSPRVVRELVAGRYSRGDLGWLELVLEDAAVPPSRRRSAARVAESPVGHRPESTVWLIRQPAAASLPSQAWRAGLVACAAGLALAHAVRFGLWIAAWWVLGHCVLSGRWAPGWLAAWALLLASLIPFSLATTWLQGVMVVRGGVLLRRRMLAGVLRFDPDEGRTLGAGRILGLVLEAEGVEVHGLLGGLLAFTAAIELACAAPILAAGAGGGLHLGLLAAWLALAAGIAWRYLARRWEWTEDRLRLTHDLVESMIGHRTRLAQEPPELWHHGEDEALARYLADSLSLDRVGALLVSVVQRGWVVAGLICLAPAFASGASSRPALAVGLGAVLLVSSSLGALSAGLAHLAAAAVAWRRVRPLIAAGAHPTPTGAASSPERPPVQALQARNLVFRYPQRAHQVLDGCSVALARGERVVLDGPSGSGKSTLVSILLGLRPAQSGLVLLDGLDRPTLGPAGWRRRISGAPQLDQNHLLTGPLAFNLLLGRGWPPARSELERAEALCRELGLGDLLDRMPSGILQTVGETGWQLSHGERGRVFLARALLQGADVILLDESLAGLDPDSVRQALAAIERHAPAALLVAHA